MAIFYVDATPIGVVPGVADGHSPSAPLHGLDKVSHLKLSAGDIVALRAGAVFESASGAGPFVIHASGDSRFPVRITRYGVGENPLIRTQTDIGVDVVNSSFIKIDCIDVEGGHQAGVRTDAKSHHMTMDNMMVSNAGFGFEIHGSHSSFSHNSVHDLRMILNTPGGDDDYGAVAFAIQGDHNEFAYNRIWRAKAPSFDYGTDGGGFEFWKSVKDVKIHHNWVEDSAGFSEAGGEGAGDALARIEIFRNVSHNNEVFQWMHNAPGVGRFGLAMQGVQVHHNTLIEPTSRELIGFDGPVGAGSYVFTRNLVVAPLAKVFNQEGDFHFDNFYDVAVPQAGEGEVFGPVRVARAAAGTFKVRKGDKAEGYGADGDGTDQVGYGQQSCRSDF